MEKECFFTLRMGPNDPDVLKMLMRAAARSGYGRLILELEKGIVYRSVPEASASWAWTRETLKEIILLAGKLQLEIIPLIPTFSHCEYLLKAHDEYRESGSKVYCPASGILEKLVFPLLDEVIDLFQPKQVHIGHDEIISDYSASSRKSVFGCPVCRNRNPHEILLQEIKALRGHLKKRNLRCLMWADSLLVPENFYRRSFCISGCYGGAPDHFERLLAELPKDILLYDWHYEPAREFPTAEYLRKAGFEVVGAAAHFLNALTFRHYAQPCGVSRFLATFWHTLSPENCTILKRKLHEISRAFSGGAGQDAFLREIENPSKNAILLVKGRSREVFLFGKNGSGIFRSEGWSDLRFVEYPESTERHIVLPKYPRALEIKGNRRGWIRYHFQVPSGTVCCASLKLWMENPGRNAVILEHDGGEQIILQDRFCRGTAIKLPKLSGEFSLVMKAENIGSAKCVFLRRFELGCNCKKNKDSEQ